MTRPGTVAPPDASTADQPAGGLRDVQGITGLLATGVIVACAWAVLGVLIWNLDRGLDLTDEAHLLYLYRHPATFSLRQYWQYQSLIHAIVPSALDHVLFYRLVKLLALLATAAAFAVLLARWIERRCCFLAGYGLSPIALVHVLALASLFAFCHGSQTLSYNDVTTVLVLLVACALIAADLAGADRRGLAFALAFAAGALLVPLAFAKFPAAILLFLYCPAFFLVRSVHHGRRFALHGMAAVLCGAFALALALTDIGAGLVSFDKLYRSLSDPLAGEEHGGASELLSFYLQTSIQKLSDVIRSPAVAGLVTLPVIVMIVRSRAASRAGRIVSIVLALGVLWCLVATIVGMLLSAGQGPSWFHRYNLADLQSAMALVALFGAIAVIPAAATRAGSAAVVTAVVAGAVLGSLAVVSAMGTNNPLLTQFIRHMVFIVAALALLTALLGFAGRQPAFASGVCAAVAVLTTAQLYSTMLFNPYRLAGPARDQNVALQQPVYLKGLKVDPVTSAFIDRLISRVRLELGDTRNLPMLVMLEAPGVTYLLDGVSVGSPWFYDRGQVVEATCRQVAADPLSRERVRLVVLDRDMPSGIVECLRHHGIDLSTYREFVRIDLPGDAAPRRTLRLLTPEEARR